MISIVIPAYNEGGVIERALTAITAGTVSNELEVIVVCNGCTDETATIARSFGPPVKVVETNVGNKAHALNLGDETASSFPRVYVDADVVATAETIRAMARRLSHGDVLVVAPVPTINLLGCSWLVRAYFSIRSRLPSAREGVGGSGVYALSEAGRRRFSKFPDLTADDGYVRVQFNPEERETLQAVSSVVFAPRTMRDLILIRTRAYYGSVELARKFPELWKNRGESNHRAIGTLVKKPLLWPGLLIYILVNAVARYRAIVRIRSRKYVWERDSSARNISATSSDLLRGQS